MSAIEKLSTPVLIADGALAVRLASLVIGLIAIDRGVLLPGV